MAKNMREISKYDTMKLYPASKECKLNFLIEKCLQFY